MANIITYIECKSLPPKHKLALAHILGTTGPTDFIHSVRSYIARLHDEIDRTDDMELEGVAMRLTELIDGIEAAAEEIAGLTT